MTISVEKSTVVIGNVEAPSNGSRGFIDITIFQATGVSFKVSASCHWYNASDAHIKHNCITAIVPAGGSYDTHEENTSGNCNYT